MSLLTLAAEMEIVFSQQCRADLLKIGSLNNSAFDKAEIRMSLHVILCVSESERRRGKGRGKRRGKGKEPAQARLENESGGERRAGERDKENLERGVIGFENPFNISTYRQFHMTIHLSCLSCL